MTSRGVICKIYNDHYYLLTQQGDFVRVNGNPPPGCQVGSSIALPRRRRWPAVAGLAAALALAVLAGVLAYPVATPQSNLLAVEFNPGLELAYDSQFSLTGWQGLNPQGQQILAAAELKEGQSLYLALEQLLDICQAEGLLNSGQTVLITSGGDEPDADLLLGALEGRGLNLQVLWLPLARQDYHSEDDGPLRNHLKRLAAQQGEELELETGADVAAVASQMLADAVVEHQVPGWFDNPVLQHLVERHRISHESIQWMQQQGLDSAQIAAVAQHARTQGKSPRKLAELLLEDGEIPELDSASQTSLAQVIEGQPALEYLGELFGHSPGRLVSLLARGLSSDDISLLLLLERHTGSDLDQLLRELEGEEEGVGALARKHDLEGLEEEKQAVNEKIQSIGNNPSQEDARQLARRYGVPPGQAMRLLADGYSLAELEEVIQLSVDSGYRLPEVAQLIEEVDAVDQLLAKLGLQPAGRELDNIRQRIRERVPGPPPGKGRP